MDASIYSHAGFFKDGGEVGIILCLCVEASHGFICFYYGRG